MDTHRPAVVDVRRRRNARRGLALFLALVVMFEAVFVIVLVSTGNLLWIFALMWSVALASVITRLVRREGFADVSFRFGGRRTWRYIAFGVVFAVVVGSIAYGIAWVTGLAPFEPPAVGLVASLAGRASPVVVFLVGLVLAATVGTVFGTLSAAGEEIGWRGYMLTRLIDAGWPYPVLASGLIWGVWHLPLVFTGAIYADHPSAFMAAAVFVVSAVGASFVLAWVRLQSGSIWPAIVLHAAYNSVIQSAFDPARAGEGSLWVGEEAGLLIAVVLVIAAVVVSRRPWRMLRAPGAPMERTAVVPS